MATMYKLVTQNMTSYGDMKWEIGVTNKAIVDGNKMCSNQVLHCYASPLIAVIFNPIHADICNPILLEIECSDIVATDGIKYACKEQTPVKLVALPQVSTTQKIAFTIKCALLVCETASFITWANNWLDGTNRTAAAAAKAAKAAYAAAAYAAAYAATKAAAKAAAKAAKAAYAADAAKAAKAAYATAYAAYATANAAYAADAAKAAYAADAAKAAYAAAAAKAAYATINLHDIMLWVMENIA